jgi:hypothetical protein
MTALFILQRTVLTSIWCSRITGTSRADDGWTEHAAAAVKKAAAESKDTPSPLDGRNRAPANDWKKKAFSKAEFGPEAIKNFAPLLKSISLNP